MAEANKDSASNLKEVEQPQTDRRLKAVAAFESLLLDADKLEKRMKEHIRDLEFKEPNEPLRRSVLLMRKAEIEKEGWDTLESRIENAYQEASAAWLSTNIDPLQAKYADHKRKFAILAAKLRADACSEPKESTYHCIACHSSSHPVERCQKALNEFLEQKRDKFPRFYFISDDDLLEILGQSRNVTVIQSHLKKLFMGIHAVRFDKASPRSRAPRRQRAACSGRRRCP